MLSCFIKTLALQHKFSVSCSFLGPSFEVLERKFPGCWLQEDYGDVLHSGDYLSDRELRLYSSVAARILLSSFKSFQ